MAKNALKDFVPAPPPKPPKVDTVVMSVRVRTEVKERFNELLALDETPDKIGDLISALISREYFRYFEE